MAPEEQWPIARVPQPLGIYALELLRRSEQFGAAFAALDVHPTSKLHYPAYFLLSHAVELSLKAFLAASGTDKATLRKLDHNLKRISRRAANAGLPEVVRLDLLIAQLSNLNKEHSLRYPGWTFLSFPMPSECLEVLEALQHAVRPQVNTAAVKARFRLWALHAPPVRYEWTD